MSKGLEALKDLREVKGWNNDEFERRLTIIEAELKKYEELTSKPIVLCGRTHGQTQALIDYICKNYKEVKITNFEDENKLKALEIIKAKKVDMVILDRAIYIEGSHHYYNKEIEKHLWTYEDKLLTKSEIDLLKEVLL